MFEIWLGLELTSSNGSLKAGFSLVELVYVVFVLSFSIVGNGREVVRTIWFGWNPESREGPGSLGLGRRSLSLSSEDMGEPGSGGKALKLIALRREWGVVGLTTKEARRLQALAVLLHWATIWPAALSIGGWESGPRRLTKGWGAFIVLGSFPRSEGSADKVLPRSTTLEAQATEE